MEHRKRLLIIVEISFMTALAVILDYMTLFKLPYGGSVNLVMIPVIVIALRRGYSAGILCGVLAGMMLLLLGGQVYHPVQAILDYPVGLGVLGLAGLVSIKGTYSYKFKLLLAFLAVFISGGARFLAHYLSGVVFFGQYAKGESPYLYSLIYNASYILPAIILSILAIAFILYSVPQLVVRNK